MRTLSYKREWRAKERIKSALARGILVSWWRTMGGEVRVVVRKLPR